MATQTPSSARSYTLLFLCSERGAGTVEVLGRYWDLGGLMVGGTDCYDSPLPTSVPPFATPLPSPVGVRCQPEAVYGKLDLHGAPRYVTSW